MKDSPGQQQLRGPEKTCPRCFKKKKKIIEDDLLAKLAETPTPSY